MSRPVGMGMLSVDGTLLAEQPRRESGKSEPGDQARGTDQQRRRVRARYMQLPAKMPGWHRLRQHRSRQRAQSAMTRTMTAGKIPDSQSQHGTGPPSVLVRTRSQS